MFYIVGTAGHIDHGKTAMTKILTGVDTDRLKEEHDRGISIKLGFAPLKLSKDIDIGLIDVPGHERFIKEMLSGVGGMNLVILVVAANDGIMPQTKEHLEIIKILGIKNIVVALTKIDLVEEDYIPFVEEEISDYLISMGFADKPIVPISNKERTGFNELKVAIEKEINKIELNVNHSYARMPIDRVFQISGVGTIVTGTLWSGEIKKNDNLYLLPAEKLVKIRNIQVHGENKESAYYSQRVALNIPDVKISDIPHGSLLIAKKIFNKTFKINCVFNLLPGKKRVKNKDQVYIYLGTGSNIGKIILLDREELDGGDESLVSFYLEKPINCMDGDHLVIRGGSPLANLGGAIVLESNTLSTKRYNKEVLERLNGILKGSKESIALEKINKSLIIKTQDILDLYEFDKDEFFSYPTISENILEFGEYLITKTNFKIIEEGIGDEISSALKKNSLSMGISLKEAHSKKLKELKINTFKNLICEMDSLALNENLISFKKTHEISDKDQEIINKILEILSEYPQKPPSRKMISEELKIVNIDNYFNYLLRRGDILRLTQETYYMREYIEKIQKEIEEKLSVDKSITLGEFRDMISTSRKYALEILEYMDSIKVTRKLEDKRIKY